MNTIYNPNELFQFLNTSLIPIKEKKEQNGEVFTPIPFIEDMMDKLTDANPTIWSNPNLKWLDPAAGIGNFAVVVYFRLMDGLKAGIPNDEERQAHILENMLYMVEYDKTNSSTMNSIFCGKINIFTGSFIDGKKYNSIDIFSLDENMMADENKLFSRKVKSFGGKFDVIMGNPPYNSGGISSKKKNNNENKKTIWNLFIENSFKYLRDTAGYLLFINPLTWLKSTHNCHQLMLEKHIIWLSLWDASTSLRKFNSYSGEIPISIFLLQNIKNTKKLKTIIDVEYSQIKYEFSNYEYYLDKSLSIPLGFFSSLLKLQKFVRDNDIMLDYKTTKVSNKYLLKHYIHNSKKDDLPETYKLEDNYNVDTFKVKEGMKVNRSAIRHTDADKSKLIIANKASLVNGIIIDDGRLGICGSNNYYILGDTNTLELYRKIFNFKLIEIASLFTKFRQNFLDTDVFLYIPDLPKLGYETENELYKLIKLTKEEINDIENFRYS